MQTPYKDRGNALERQVAVECALVTRAVSATCFHNDTMTLKLLADVETNAAWRTKGSGQSPLVIVEEAELGVLQLKLDNTNTTPGQDGDTRNNLELRELRETVRTHAHGHNAAPGSTGQHTKRTALTLINGPGAAFADII
jgi:hypothetical protein